MTTIKRTKQILSLPSRNFHSSKKDIKQLSNKINSLITNVASDVKEMYRLLHSMVSPHFIRTISSTWQSITPFFLETPVSTGFQDIPLFDFLPTLLSYAYCSSQSLHVAMANGRFSSYHLYIMIIHKFLLPTWTSLLSKYTAQWPSPLGCTNIMPQTEFLTLLPNLPYLQLSLSRLKATPSFQLLKPKILGVNLDSSFFLTSHIQFISRSCWLHLHKIQKGLTPSTTFTAVTA